MIYYDTETCGLHGMATLIQYAVDDGPITLYSLWRETVLDTLKLIEWMMDQEVCGFNLAFDHFHLCKIYTIWTLIDDPYSYPEDIIDEIATKEPLGCDVDLCLKPKAACDIMLHARKGKYQSTMERKDIKIKKIPNVIAWDLADYLEKNIKFDDIYFSRRKDHNAPRWAVYDREDEPDFKDIVLKFKASAALKNLAIHALGKDPNEVLKYGVIEPRTYPVEVGYAPYALGVSNANKNWRAKVKTRTGYAWPAIIKQHISHWSSNKLAKQYAEDDVTYTRELYKHLGSPVAGDIDSTLACFTAANRWKGYKVDIEKLKVLKDEMLILSESAPKAPNASKAYLTEVMDTETQLIYDISANGSTSRLILEDIATWDGEVSKRAQQILEARQAKSKLDLIHKLLVAGKLHASFSIIGALSGRMSGSGGDLNTQGIKREDKIRECFPLSCDNMVLCGGDFDSFEVALAVAYYKDEKLESEILSGKKIHALFGTNVYPDMTYEDILKDKEKYTRSKSAVFAMIYGGEAYTLKTRLGVDLETAEEAYQKFIKNYPGIGRGRAKINEMFCSMRQPNGIGTAIHWNEPHDYIETMFGFRRYFTLENKICKALFNLASNLPKEWKAYKGKVTRRDRQQTISGSCSSALYAAAFTIQSANMRAAGNHVIQGSGAEITKKLQYDIIQLQSSGIHRWVVQPMNIHDELMCPTNIVNKVKETVEKTVNSYKNKVPLISMTWNVGLKSWADK